MVPYQPAPAEDSQTNTGSWQHKQRQLLSHLLLSGLFSVHISQQNQSKGKSARLTNKQTNKQHVKLATVLTGFLLFPQYEFWNSHEGSYLRKIKCYLFVKTCLNNQINKHVNGELFCHLLESLYMSFNTVNKVYPTEKPNFTLSSVAWLFKTGCYSVLSDCKHTTVWHILLA